MFFQNGAFGTVTTSWTHYAEECNATVLYCEKGSMKIYVNPSFPLEVVYADGSKMFYEMDAIQSNDEDVQLSSGVIDLFVDAVLKEKPTVLDAEQIIGSMRVVFACLDSNETGKQIHL